METIASKELTRKVRSYRNNNPLNIKRNARNKWYGARRTQTDKVFEEFEELEYGVRAALVVLKKYIDMYGCNTLDKIISRWAPAAENGEKSTKNYINRVALHLRKHPQKDLLQFADKDTIAKLVEGMTIVESGTLYSPVPDYREFIMNVYDKYFDYE